MFSPRSARIPFGLVPGVLVFVLAAASVQAAPFTTAYLDGGSWNTVYAQGFDPSVSPNPDPGVAPGGTVYLNQFQFFKSGTADTAADVRLAILDNLYANLQGLTTTSSSVLGLSTNTITSTAPLATGDAITFDFDSLALPYGGDYGAVFVNVGPGGELTPVRVSALTANYQDNGSGEFHPATNYGTENQFQYATSNFINTDQFGSFFSAFSFAGDANFRATFDTQVPEPTFAGLAAVGAVAATLRRRRRRRRRRCS